MTLCIDWMIEDLRTLELKSA